MMPILHQQTRLPMCGASAWEQVLNGTIKRGQCSSVVVMQCARVVVMWSNTTREQTIKNSTNKVQEMKNRKTELKRLINFIMQ